jgi:serine/threonine protein phosphatase PrpC
MTALDTACRACGYAVGSAADAWCEACGAALTAEPPVPPEAPVVVDAGRVAGVSDAGRVRSRNEDAFAVEATERGLLAVVCDGVASSRGGRAAAHEAARAAVAALAATMCPGGTWEPAGAMEAAVERAAAAVAALAPAGTDPGRAPSCTFVAAAWDGTSVTLASVGDSRAYWVGAGGSRRLTVDDSWAQEQVAAGVMTERTAMRQPQAHAITGWLGADAPPGPWRVTAFAPPGPGHVVLCSDGLWNHTPDADAIAALLDGEIGPPVVLATRLVQAALVAGGQDNVTVVVMEVGP